MDNGCSVFTWSQSDVIVGDADLTCDADANLPQVELNRVIVTEKNVDQKNKLSVTIKAFLVRLDSAILAHFCFTSKIIVGHFSEATLCISVPWKKLDL